MSHARGLVELRTCLEIAAMLARACRKMARHYAHADAREQADAYNAMAIAYDEEEAGYLRELAEFDMKTHANPRALP